MAEDRTPLVSVIIPVYNGAAFLAEAIDSVFQQTYPNIEIVAVDDGSTDDSQAVLKSFGTKIAWVSQENTGVAASRNTALRLTQGKYVALLDQDDLWLPEKIRLQVEAFANHPNTVLVWGGAVRSTMGKTDLLNDETYHEDRRRYGLKELLIFDRIAALTSMFMRDMALLVGGFDEKAPPCDDWDLWIRLTQLGPIHYLDKTVAIYRVHDKQASKDYYKLALGELRVIKKHRNTFYKLPRGKSLYRSQLARRLSVAAMECVKVSEYRKAKKLSLQGLLQMRADVWPICLKILLECAIGTSAYSQWALKYKKIATRCKLNLKIYP